MGASSLTASLIQWDIYGGFAELIISIQHIVDSCSKTGRVAVDFNEVNVDI